MVQGTYANVRHHIEVFTCEMALDDIDQLRQRFTRDITRRLGIDFLQYRFQ